MNAFAVSPTVPAAVGIPPLAIHSAVADVPSTVDFPPFADAIALVPGAVGISSFAVEPAVAHRCCLFYLWCHFCLFSISAYAGIPVAEGTIAVSNDVFCIAGVLLWLDFYYASLASLFCSIPNVAGVPAAFFVFLSLLLL